MPLVAETAGYDFKGRRPTGRCLVEENAGVGKVSVNVLDLKPQVRYTVCLIFGQSGKYVGLPIGQVMVDDKGKGELRSRITPTDLHSFVLAEMVAIAVMVGAGTESPLCGYRADIVAWKGNFKFWELEAKHMPESESKAKPEAELESPPVATTVEATQGQAHDKPQSSDINLPDCRTPDAPCNNTVEACPLPDDDTISIGEQAIADDIRNDEARLDENETADPLQSIFDQSTPVEPFAKQDRPTKWVRITKPALIPLPPDAPHLLSEPFLLTTWADHEHFIFGTPTDGEQPVQYTIGAPGTYTQGDKLAAKRLGFLQFKCHKKERPRIGDTGYWLMHVPL